MKPKRGKMKLSRASSGKREDHRLVWRDCENVSQCGESVRVPADTEKVTCGWCVQKMLGKPEEAKRKKQAA
jgi:hypothetical protein